MKNKITAVLVAVTVFLLAISLSPAMIFADITEFDGELTEEYTFIRPSFIGPPFAPGSTSYNYFVRQLTPDTTGSYIVEVTDVDPMGLDPTLYLYEGSFDPDNPIDNLVAADDDSGAGLYPLITYNMTAGTDYIVVMSTFSLILDTSYD